MNISRRCNGNILRHLQLTIIIVCIATLSTTVIARDTDIYDINTKQNTYVLMDNSGSMDFGVYEHTIDYGEMYDYLITLNDGNPPSETYIWDTVNDWPAFYHNHQDRNKIYLLKGDIGVTLATVDGEEIAFTGDAADPEYLWHGSDLIDTNVTIDSSGNLTYDGSGTQRITVDTDGHILLDGNRLPLGQDIKLHDLQTLYDGSVIDNGFGGLLNAPGYLFSGYKYDNGLTVAEDGDTTVYYFITGNWINMQAMYNLHYVTNNPDPQGASKGDPAWKYEIFPITTASWFNLAYSVRYPDSGVYDNDIALDTEGTVKKIVHAGATQIMVHFSAFDVEGGYDYVSLYDGSGKLITEYSNDEIPADHWSVAVDGDTIILKFESDESVQRTGYEIDQIKVTYNTDSYLMQNRLDIAKDAMLYVLDEFHGKMNWGFATFHYLGTTADGATLHSVLNPNLTDDQNRAAIQNHIENVEPMYGTPLGEALQDMYEKGFYTLRHSLDNLPCRKNYIISVTDGFPSGDNDWKRISGVTFTDSDADGWTEDPYQYNTPPPDYYDDVAHWMYTHSWQDDDKQLVADPENSFKNVITHHIAFGARHPLLQDAAGESGGKYITAYNKTQLVAAFYALSLEMTEAVSFTAPVVSVDSQNKIQNGDDLYMGVFLPQGSSSWVGNLKKYVLGDGSTDRPDIWMLYDGGDNEAIDYNGEFKDNLTAFWADDNDANDSDNYGAADVKEDGVGEVLIERVKANLIAGASTSSEYWERPIYTYLSGAMTKVDQTNISSADLGVADDAEKNALINYIHGYTNEANSATGEPLFARDWALGAIIHSRPAVIDYYDPTDIKTLLKRYIAIGANDGMLHIFDDSNGKEVFAFVPPDLLPELKLLPTTPLVDTVDGRITLYRRDKTPKYLIFGERRGGKYYWALDISDSDPLNWTVAWSYTNAEIQQTWSEVFVATIPTSINSDGVPSFKDVAIFTGGYDTEEDDYPEPFLDVDNNGTPYTSDGQLDANEWKQTEATQDVNGNGTYDISNPGMNEHGRGVYIVDIDNPTNIVSDILPFSVTYGSTNIATGSTQTRTDMKYCFPASPSVAMFTENYLYREMVDSAWSAVIVLKSNILKSLYVTDIYANTYKISFDFNITKDTSLSEISAWTWSATKDWKVTKVFSSNPGSDNNSGTFSGSDDSSDSWRKAFYSPAISWGGSCKYFDKGNYNPIDSDSIFYGTNEIATLFFGTGDREHPKYTMIRNRLYSVYDDSTIVGEKISTSTPITVSTVPYTENDLMNLSCDELDINTTINSGATKEEIQEGITDNHSYLNSAIFKYEDGIYENDAKGWYIILEDQGDSTACSHCSYSATVDDSTTTSRDNHDGEKILSKPVIYAGIVYFTSYQPSPEDPCNPHGNGLAYSVNYCDATSAYDLNDNNGVSRDVTDRYQKYNNILGIPSGFSIITRKGEAGGMSMMGGQGVGAKGTDDLTIKTPGMGLELYYWREGNSLK